MNKVLSPDTAYNFPTQIGKAKNPGKNSRGRGGFRGRGRGKGSVNRK